MSRRGRIRFSAEFQEFEPPSDDAVRAAVRATIDTAAEFARALWYQRAQDMGIRRSGAYLQGIADAEVRILSEQSGESTVDVVFEIVNHSPDARIVEDGHAAFSLPKSINWGGPRVKQGKNGPYMHIPFGHSAFATPEQQAAQGLTPGTVRAMMPEDVYQKAKRLRYTTPKREGPIYRTNDAGARQFVAADRYSSKPGPSRLPELFAGPQITPGPGRDAWRPAWRVAGRTRTGQRLTNPAWKSSRFTGMMKGGSPGHTEYVTIRTITPRSAGFNIPAMPGYGVARQVAGALNQGIGAERFRELLIGAAVAAVTGGR
jgi:hypothetical protein